MTRDAEIVFPSKNPNLIDMNRDVALANLLLFAGMLVHGYYRWTLAVTDPSFREYVVITRRREDEAHRASLYDEDDPPIGYYRS